jgi:hypothetical protein
MKAEIHASGNLVIRSETTLEAYSLRKWSEEHKQSLKPLRFIITDCSFPISPKEKPMQTNDYLDKYINLQAKARNIRNGLSELCYRNKSYNVSVTPTHFNYFSLKLKVEGSEINLPVKDAREIAQFILDSTKGLEDTHDIMEEISKLEEA